jgi:hypothetical protein
VRVAIASFTGKPPEFRDDDLLIDLLATRGIEAAGPSWDDRSVDWDSFDLVVARSPWDYTWRLEEFLGWADAIGERLENPPPVIRWNSDKRYLADLREDGLPVVETTYVAPGEPPPPIEAEVVIKPSVSGGARDTGRFGPGSAGAGRALVERICAGGATAMIQPYLDSVEASGETAVIMIGGEVSHVLRKGPLLAADEVAPVREGDALGVAEIMYDPDLVVAGSATDAELGLAHRILEAVDRRFGVTPLIARVDMLRDSGGDPVLLELEAIEPNLYFEQSPGAAERLADTIAARASRRT